MLASTIGSLAASTCMITNSSQFFILSSTHAAPMVPASDTLQRTGISFCALHGNILCTRQPQNRFPNQVLTCPHTAPRAAARLSSSKRTASLSGCSTRAASREYTAASAAGWGTSCTAASLATATGGGRDRISSSCGQAERNCLGMHPSACMQAMLSQWQAWAVRHVVQQTSLESCKPSL